MLMTITAGSSSRLPQNLSGWPRRRRRAERPTRTSGREIAAGRRSGCVTVATAAVELRLQALTPTFQITQLALEVGLEPGAVLALELLELLDVLLECRPLGIQCRP